MQQKKVFLIRMAMDMSKINKTIDIFRDESLEKRKRTKKTIKVKGLPENKEKGAKI